MDNDISSFPQGPQEAPPWAQPQPPHTEPTSGDETAHQGVSGPTPSPPSPPPAPPQFPPSEPTPAPPPMPAPDSPHETMSETDETGWGAAPPSTQLEGTAEDRGEDNLDEVDIGSKAKKSKKARRGIPKLKGRGKGKQEALGGEEEPYFHDIELTDSDLSAPKSKLGFLKKFLPSPNSQVQIKNKTELPLKKGTVSIIEGRTTTTFTIVDRLPTHIKTQRYDSAQDCLDAAAKRRDYIVWAKPDVNTLRRPYTRDQQGDRIPERMQEAVDIGDINDLSSAALSLVRMGDVLYQSPSPDLEKLTKVARVFPLGMSPSHIHKIEHFFVLRVGEEYSLLTEINDGELINAFDISDISLQSVTESIESGVRPDEAVATLANQLAQSAANTIRNWRYTGDTITKKNAEKIAIFVHGPGATWPKLISRIHETSGISTVMLKSDDQIADIEGSREDLADMLPSLYSITGKPFQSVAALKRKPIRRKRIVALAWVMPILMWSIGVWIVRDNQGGAHASRVDESLAYRASLQQGGTEKSDPEFAVRQEGLEVSQAKEARRLHGEFTDRIDGGQSRTETQIAELLQFALESYNPNDFDATNGEPVIPENLRFIESVYCGVLRMAILPSESLPEAIERLNPRIDDIARKVYGDEFDTTGLITRPIISGNIAGSRTPELIYEISPPPNLCGHMPSGAEG